MHQHLNLIINNGDNEISHNSIAQNKYGNYLFLYQYQQAIALLSSGVAITTHSGSDNLKNYQNL